MDLRSQARLRFVVQLREKGYMSHRRRLLYALLLVTLVVILVALAGCWPEAPYRMPSAGLSESDLAGTWRETYATGVSDTLILRADGSFKQIYREDRVGYVYETEWERFRLQRFSDGRVWLHLPTARYFVRGVRSLLRDDFGRPCASDDLECYRQRTPIPGSYLDPVGNVSVPVDGELVLLVLSTSYGESVLAQLTEGSDHGFVILVWGRAIRFARVGPP